MRNSTKRSTNVEKAMLSWLDIHMVLIPINPKGRSPSPFPPTFAHFCAMNRSAHCKIVFWKLCKNYFFSLRDQSPSPIFTRDTFRWEWYVLNNVHKYFWIFCCNVHNSVKYYYLVLVYWSQQYCTKHPQHVVDNSWSFYFEGFTISIMLGIFFRAWTGHHYSIMI